MLALLLLFACGAPPETCLQIEASVADSNTGRCDPCAVEELSLDACGTNTCGRPLRVVPGDDGCLALYTVRDADGEIVGTPTCRNDFGWQILDGNTCERVPWTPPDVGLYELNVVYQVDGQVHSESVHNFEVTADAR